MCGFFAASCMKRRSPRLSCWPGSLELTHPAFKRQPRPLAALFWTPKAGKPQALSASDTPSRCRLRLEPVSAMAWLFWGANMRRLARRKLGVRVFAEMHRVPMPRLGWLETQPVRPL